MLVIRPIASTTRRASSCTAEIWAPISPVASPVWVARDFTSLATTAKPLPASPARAASMVALRARRLVWEAMSSISLRTTEIRSAAPTRALTVSSVRLASWEASSDAVAAWLTCWLISVIEAASSSDAAATVWALDVAASAVPLTSDSSVSARDDTSSCRRDWAATCSVSADTWSFTSISDPQARKGLPCLSRMIPPTARNQR